MSKSKQKQKYTKEELTILHTQGPKSLRSYHSSFRKPIPTQTSSQFDSGKPNSSKSSRQSTKKETQKIVNEDII